MHVDVGRAGQGALVLTGCVCGYKERERERFIDE